MTITRTRRITRFAAAGTVAALAAALTFSAVTPAVAAAPVGSPDAYSVTQDTALNVTAPGLWANDSDPEGDALDYQSVSPPAGGPLPGESLNVLANGGQGAFEYTPPTGFTGVRVWTYFLNDGVDVSGAIEVTFTISAPVVTTVPVAVADAFDVVPDTALVVPAPGLYANDYDTDGDSWSYKFVLQPILNALPGESLDISAGGGAFTYTPPTGYTGVRVWSYSIQGDDGESELVDITFTVGTPNAVPVAVADAHAATAGVPFIVTAPGALGNDTDADADALVVSGWDAPAGGLLVGEDFALNANGSFEYLAPVGYSGARVFTYRVSDGTDESADGTITFTVSVPTPNAAPIALPDAYLVEQDVTLVVTAPGVLGNDTDADGDPLSVAQMFAPAGGALLGESLVLNPNGSFEYNPAANFTGVRTWRYEATDGTDPADYVDIVFTVAAAGPAPEPQPGPEPEPELETEATGTSETAALAATGDDSVPFVAVVAALILAMGATLVRSSRRAA
jgi:phage-related protein